MLTESEDQQDADALHALIAEVVGVEIRRARDVVRWTRAEVVKALPSQLHEQSLAMYERGDRQCTVGRFVEICATLGVSAPDMLTWALQRGKIELPILGVHVDLRALVKSRESELVAVRRWAHGRLADDPDAGIVHLEWSVVKMLARHFDIPNEVFVGYLIRFTPRPVPRWPSPGMPPGRRARADRGGC